MKSTAFWDIAPCSLLNGDLVSEEHVASIFRVKESISMPRYIFD
jgi:hypothetical protein